MRVVGVLIDRNNSQNVVHFYLALLGLETGFCVWMRQVDEDEVRQVDAQIRNARKPELVDDLAQVGPVIVFAEDICEFLERLAVFLGNVRPGLVQAVNAGAFQSRSDGEQRVKIIKFKKTFAELYEVRHDLGAFFGAGAVQNLLDRPEAGVVEASSEGDDVRSDEDFILFGPRATRQFVHFDGRKDRKIEEGDLRGEFFRRNAKRADDDVVQVDGGVGWQAVGFVARRRCGTERIIVVTDRGRLELQLGWIQRSNGVFLLHFPFRRLFGAARELLIVSTGTTRALSVDAKVVEALR